MFAQKNFECFFIALPRFAKHPTACFMNEIMLVVHEYFGDLEGRIEFLLADHGERRDNGDATLPKIF